MKAQLYSNFNRPAGTVEVIGVSASSNLRRLIDSLLTRSGWSFKHVASCADALRTMEESGASVVVTDTHLPDGTWRDLVTASRKQPAPPAVVVASRHADEQLWTDVIEHGAFDLVSVPGESSEFLRVVRLAVHQGAVSQATA